MDLTESLHELWASEITSLEYSCPQGLRVPQYWMASTSTWFASLFTACDRLKTLGHWNFPPTPCSLSEDHWLTPQKKELSSKLHFSWYQLTTHSSRLGKKNIPGKRLSDKFRICVQWQKFIFPSWFLLLRASAGEAGKNLACWLSVWSEFKYSSSKCSVYETEHHQTVTVSKESSTWNTWWHPLDCHGGSLMV